LRGDAGECRRHLVEHRTAFEETLEPEVEPILAERPGVEGDDLSQPGLTQVSQRLVHELTRHADAIVREQVQDAHAHDIGLAVRGASGQIARDHALKAVLDLVQVVRHSRAPAPGFGD
jgi:hypothetical protein